MAQQDRPVPSSVPFPRSSEVSLAMEELSHGRSRVDTWRRTSALEVHELVYGSGEKDSDALRVALERLYEGDAVYENPLVTADGRSLITEIYTLTRACSDVSVPRPLAMLSVLFAPDGERKAPWFKMLRVWSEVLDVCESESFDGNRTALLEQVLHVLVLPDLHTSSGQPSQSADSLPPRDSMSTVSLLSTAHIPVPPPRLSLPGLQDIPLPSPFHYKFRILTRLSFNERGRIAHHRDFWDVRDIFESTIPGARACGWLGRRAASYGLAGLAWLLPRLTPSAPLTAPPSPVIMRTSLPLTRAQQYALATTGTSQAPDVDRDSMY